MSKLFSELTVKDMTLKNRIVMAPMCMYSADSYGYSTDWHYAHYHTRAIGGTGLILQEATAVEGRGRISDADLGIWDDSHIEGLKRIVQGCQAEGAKVGIQLAHAGRKCTVATETIIAPSPLPFDDNSRVPMEMNVNDIESVKNAFKSGAIRAREVGYDIIEIHAAHGYLINEFLSPLTNKRSDKYGGSLVNRTRFLKEIVHEVRSVWPIEKPLIIRVSAEDYHPEGNHPKDIAKILNMVKDLGVDLINVSSGAVVPAKIKVYPGYQIKHAEIIKTETSLPVIGGGLITSSEMAEELVQNKRVDLLYLGRELLRNPYWPLQAAGELKHEVEWPVQYERSKV
ncbi:NADPH dehydrogenase NamA [Alkaliphilus peptidifermentans]|uniref:NADPH2 dehydrogenase n=1 Tax=Alkaliphilus peptidifermentans DSM 18978 TaxID=1120976 RepID=A0A1G5KQA4_9FIRM|nr:NADPH dehydrogenase NamA [Alkaliphilus peptidifermentans]SCZ02129.1 NADPH2 dehydrogenase [Alkaliphilus peptidifermentans DSM 18978]